MTSPDDVTDNAEAEWEKSAEPTEPFVCDQRHEGAHDGNADAYGKPLVGQPALTVMEPTVPVALDVSRARLPSWERHRSACVIVVNGRQNNDKLSTPITPPPWRPKTPNLFSKPTFAAESIWSRIYQPVILTGMAAPLLVDL